MSLNHLFIDAGDYSDTIKNMKNTRPLGIELLCYIYLVNVALYLVSQALFDNRIFILGKEANIYIAVLVRLLLILIPVYLAFRLKGLRKDAFFVALLFHLYFIINNCLSFLEHKGYAYALVRITGVYGSTIYSPRQIFVLALSIALNIFILGYILKVREYFFADN